MVRGRKGIGGKNNSPNYNSQGVGGNNGTYRSREEKALRLIFEHLLFSTFWLLYVHITYKTKHLKKLKERQKREFINSKRKSMQIKQTLHIL